MKGKRAREKRGIQSEKRMFILMHGQFTRRGREQRGGEKTHRRERKRSRETETWSEKKLQGDGQINGERKSGGGADGQR